MLSFKPTSSFSIFTFIKRLCSSSSLSAIRVVLSAPPHHGAGGESGCRAPAAGFRAPLLGGARPALLSLAGGRQGARKVGWGAPRVRGERGSGVTHPPSLPRDGLCYLAGPSGTSGPPGSPGPRGLAARGQALHRCAPGPSLRALGPTLSSALNSLFPWTLAALHRLCRQNWRNVRFPPNSPFLWVF